MKRRLPMINQGESVLEAITLPPHTVQTNRHTPSADQPGTATAARHAAVIDASTQAPALAAGTGASPPSSTATAANAAAQRAAPAEKRRHHPRAVVCGTPRRCAAGRTPERPTATSAITVPTDSTTSSRPTSTNAGSSAWVFPHGPQRTRRTKIR